MLLISFLIFLITIPVWAVPKDLIHSVGASLVAASSESELRDKDENTVLTFRPNVSTGVGLALETEHIGLAYTFAGKEAQEKDFDKSKYQDFRFNFHFGHFDFRLNLQSYKGALVKSGGKSEFYKDYEVKSKNGRIHYYLNDEHLNFIRDGRKLTQRVSGNSGFHTSTSFFFGVNLDSRRIHLPDNLEPEHMDRVNQSNMKYDTTFAAFSTGPLIGYDGMINFGRAYFRGKIAGGPAFQSGGGTVNQFEIAGSFGFTISNNHLFSFGVDNFIMSFKDSDQNIANNNVEGAIRYTYAFL